MSIESNNILPGEYILCVYLGGKKSKIQKQGREIKREEGRGKSKVRKEEKAKGRKINKRKENL